jgi:hypothetical protein
MGSRRDRRILRRTEEAVRRTEPRLSVMFAHFAALSAGEAMPQAEHLGRQARRPGQRPAVNPAAMLMLVLALALIAVGLVAFSGAGTPCISRAARPAGTPVHVTPSCQARLLNYLDQKPGLAHRPGRGT